MLFVWLVFYLEQETNVLCNFHNANYNLLTTYCVIALAKQLRDTVLFENIPDEVGLVNHQMKKSRHRKVVSCPRSCRLQVVEQGLFLFVFGLCVSSLLSILLSKYFGEGFKDINPVSGFTCEQNIHLPYYQVTVLFTNFLQGIISQVFFWS